MAIKEILSIKPAPEVRKDAWWAKYVEDNGSEVTVAVAGSDIEAAKSKLYTEYEKKYGK